MLSRFVLVNLSFLTSYLYMTGSYFLGQIIMKPHPWKTFLKTKKAAIYLNKPKFFYQRFTSPFWLVVEVRTFGLVYVNIKNIKRILPQCSLILSRSNLIFLEAKKTNSWTILVSSRERFFKEQLNYFNLDKLARN